MEKTPRVSICTQVLNQSAWLKEMIASVVAQTFKDWELIIVDDGSTEDIKSIVAGFKDERISIHRFDKNKGVPFGVNLALSKARGEFVGVLAADETIADTKLADQIDYLDEHPGVECVWGLPGNGPLGLCPTWEQFELRAHNRSNEAWLRTLVNLENVPIGAASFLMRKSAMDAIGPFDEKLTVFSDHELYCRFFDQGHVGVILPYRWALDKSVDKGPGEASVRVVNKDKVESELSYVRTKHPLILPSVTGKVTVGIPCYNHAKFLPDAVASVLAQTHPVDEILILDDCSTDDFKTVVQQFTDPRIKVYSFPENKGIWDAHNQMAFRAEGLFYVPCAADDTLEPKFIEKCLAEFEKNPWLEFVASQADFIKEDGTPLTEHHIVKDIPKAVNRSRQEWLIALHPGNHYFGTGMYRTKVISDVGGWNKEYKVIADYDMYLKLLQRENIRIIEEPLSHFRLHGNNHSLLDAERARELPTLYHNVKAQYYRQQMKVIIATPFYELKGFSPYITSLVQTCRLMTQMGIDYRFMELSGDSYVHRARNTMCDVFLKDPDATDLFFIDSDMSWDPNAFIKMCLLPHPIIGGTYPVKNMWDAWTSIPKQVQENGALHFRGIELKDGSALLEAEVLAGGFLRIKRHVLELYREKYPDLWYHEPTTDPKLPDYKYTAFFAAQSEEHRFYGEDHMFSKRMREMGVSMFIYPNVDIVHWGYKPFAGNYDKFLKDRALSKTVTPRKQEAA